MHWNCTLGFPINICTHLTSIESKLFTNVSGVKKSPPQLSVVHNSLSQRLLLFHRYKLGLMVLDKSALVVIYFIVIFGILVMDWFFILVFCKEFKLGRPVTTLLAAPIPFFKTNYSFAVFLLLETHPAINLSLSALGWFHSLTTQFKPIVHVNSLLFSWSRLTSSPFVTHCNYYQLPCSVSLPTKGIPYIDLLCVHY